MRCFKFVKFFFFFFDKVGQMLTVGTEECGLPIRLMHY